MYYIEKQLTVSAAHSLELPYESKCTALHGHNWLITVCCRAAELNREGMVADFSHIKALIKNKMDHQNLNEVFPFNPTAENIARWIADNVENCYKVEVTESEHNKAIYVRDEEL